MSSCLASVSHSPHHIERRAALIADDRKLIGAQSFALARPAQPTLTWHASGGTIPGSTTVYIGVAARTGRLRLTFALLMCSIGSTIATPNRRRMSSAQLEVRAQ